MELERSAGTPNIAVFIIEHESSLIGLPYLRGGNNVARQALEWNPNVQRVGVNFNHEERVVAGLCRVFMLTIIKFGELVRWLEKVIILKDLIDND